MRTKILSLTYLTLIASLNADSQTSNTKKQKPKLEVKKEGDRKVYSVEKSKQAGDFQDQLSVEGGEILIENSFIDNIEYKGKWTHDTNDVVRTPSGGGIGVSSFRRAIPVDGDNEQKIWEELRKEAKSKNDKQHVHQHPTHQNIRQHKAR